ncbi:MAG: Type phosphodiesterase / nucleotide pyrophosphatase [Schlesneria sp.]|nr:Type phosphodiesterase / nucleotide pyrophosphatase [Schlesneria sp.]
MLHSGLGCALCILFASTAVAVEPKDRHVVVICIDGLPAYLFDDPNASMPTIRGLAAKGSRARGMTVSNPSVTWPNHTSLTTGVRPEGHGVLFNGVLERSGLGLPVKVNGRKDKSDLVHAPTIYEVMHEQGLTTAAINWPCTRNTSTIADNFPDVPESFEHTTPRLIAEMKAEGIVSDADIQNFSKLSGTVRDRVWTQAVCHVIRQRKPNLVLFHPLNLDSTHHRYGPQTSAGYTAVAFADTLVKDVVSAIDEAGIRDQTTILIVSDHGFMSIPKTLQPNVALRQAGMLTVEGTQIATARAQVVPEGGIGMVYLTVPDKIEEDRKKVVDLFRDHEGIAAILTPDDFAKYGLPHPKNYPQMADLILVAKDGYGINANAAGDDVVTISETTLGTHGFLSTNPKMNATFIAAGVGIQPGVTMDKIENIDVAPTIARLLGVELKGATGKAASQILLDPANPATAK